MRILIATVLLAGSMAANATVIRTLDGVTYEWLELTETQGLSRDQVEAQLLNVGSSLYGYQYASRALVEELFMSYASWDGLNGQHLNPGIVPGLAALVDDFGVTWSDFPPDGELTLQQTVDGGIVPWDYALGYFGLYGLADECGIGKTCRLNNTVLYDDAIGAVAGSQASYSGWDANRSLFSSIAPLASESWDNTGSYLVRVSTVPVPAAVWLFGSALAGLGWLRRMQAV